MEDNLHKSENPGSPTSGDTMNPNDDLQKRQARLEEARLKGEEMIARQARLEAELLSELAQREVVEVVGVIDAYGMGGASADGKEPWTMRFALAAWKVPGGSLRVKPLGILKQVSQAELGSSMAAYDAYDVLRLRARLAEDNASGTPQALLVAIVGKITTDEELNQYAAKLQEPVRFEDRQFGWFTLERRGGLFEGRALWGEEEVTLYVHSDDGEKAKEALAFARQLFEHQADWTRKVQDCAVKELLEVKNEAWLEEGESAVSAEAFRRRMILDSISIRPDGELEFSFLDGDLFWGHTIVVRATLETGPYEANPG